MSPAEKQYLRRTFLERTDVDSPLDKDATVLGLWLPSVQQNVATAGVVELPLGRLGPEIVNAFGGDENRVVAWIYKVGVHPSFQGRGFGSQMSLAALRLAAENTKAPTVALVAAKPALYEKILVPRPEDAFVLSPEGREPPKVVVPMERLLDPLRRELGAIRSGLGRSEGAPAVLGVSLPSIAS